MSEQTPVETTDAQAVTQPQEQQDAAANQAPNKRSTTALGWFNFLLIILLAGLLAIAGWYGWQHHNILVDELAHLNHSQSRTQLESSQQINSQKTVKPLPKFLQRVAKTGCWPKLNTYCELPINAYN